MPKTSIQQEENALLVMVVLGESVVSARVKKYFFAQRTMRVTPNVFFSLAGKAGIGKSLFWEIKSCFEISLRIQPFLLAPRRQGRSLPRRVDVSPGPEDQGKEFDVGFPQALSVTRKPGTIHNYWQQSFSCCFVFSKNLLMDKIPVKLYVYDISRGFAKQLSPLLLGESFIRQWKSCTYIFWSIRLHAESLEWGTSLTKWDIILSRSWWLSILIIPTGKRIEGVWYVNLKFSFILVPKLAKCLS